MRFFKWLLGLEPSEFPEIERRASEREERQLIQLQQEELEQRLTTIQMEVSTIQREKKGR